ncbi:multicopper oxidase domain-containing protein [Bradyrhizobium sp. USDA 4452]
MFIKGGYTIITRSRYRRHIGDFVFHCHILDREDRGMMQNVRGPIPDGAGGVANGRH